VIGVDVQPQPRYPYPFIQADALTLDPAWLATFDLVWASWPCQRFSALRHRSKYNRAKAYPDLITPGRALLIRSGTLYIMENVIGAPLANPVLLCGTMFGLDVLRHRLFESNLLLWQPHHPAHEGPTTPCGRKARPGDRYMTVAGNHVQTPRARAAMGIDWMSRQELNQAIPLAYSEYLGAQIMRALTNRSVRCS